MQTHTFLYFRGFQWTNVFMNTAIKITWNRSVDPNTKRPASLCPLLANSCALTLNVCCNIFYVNSIHIPLEWSSFGSPDILTNANSLEFLVKSIKLCWKSSDAPFFFSSFTWNEFLGLLGALLTRQNITWIRWCERSSPKMWNIPNRETQALFFGTNFSSLASHFWQKCFGGVAFLHV